MTQIFLPRKKGDISVSEKEEKMMDNFIKTIPKLSERHQGYLVGLAEGMALMSEKSSDGEDDKCDKAV